MSAHENPFAFPLAVPGDCMVQPTDGMTLRDWFAGKALNGMMASEAGVDPYSAEWVSERAYLVADAMLAERLK